MRTRAKTPPASKQALRGDIQGLRAVAVGLVILDHVIAWPRGGFIGVDVFFVLSGFLITGLLLRELKNTGTVRLGRFYVRRVKRLLPAASLVLIAGVIGAHFLLSPARAGSIRLDAMWSGLFAANWRFASTGTNYFEADGPESPFQHFWSLSVEEQFYFVWPFLIVALALLIAAARRRKRLEPSHRAVLTAITIAIGALCLASFIWATFETVENPTVAYFSTFSRAWELGLGAMLALSIPLLKGLPRWASILLSWMGVLGVVSSALFLNPVGGFPAPLAMMPVVSTMLIIIGGSNGRYGGPILLRNPAMKYMGDVSYSLYLWHFPVIIILGGLLERAMNGRSPAYYAALIASMCALSVLSYHLVENPIRRSNWLTGAPKAQRRSSGRLVPNKVWLVSIAAVTAMACIGAVVVDQSARQTPPASSSSSSSSSPTPTSDGDLQVDAQVELSAQISAALAASEWPSNLTPALDSLEDSPEIVGDFGRCGDFVVRPASECTAGDSSAPKRAILVGDSIAQAYIPALTQVFGNGEWSLRTVSMYACPFIDLRVGDLLSRIDACETRRAQQVQAVIDESPDLVIVANTYFRSTNQETGRPATISEFATGLQDQIRQLDGHAKQILYLSPPPIDVDISECYTPYSKPSDCVSSVESSDWISSAQANSTVIEDAGGTFIDTRSWFCSKDGKCPAFINDTVVKKDLAHITAAFSLKIAPVLQQALISSGVIG